MPCLNSRKQYLENGYYHLYNRGVEKRIIFLDEQDYSVFLSYLKEYLLPKDKDKLLAIISDPNIPYQEKDKIYKLLQLNNFAGEITLLAYCLMPNHFHFFVKQNSQNSIDKFMNSLCTRYTMYFNKKYKRVGSLYQGVYKAVLITSDEQFVYLSKYIHLQALASQGEALRGQEPQPSSYPEYLKIRDTQWVNPDEVLEHFINKITNISSTKSYKKFVESDSNIAQIEKFDLDESL